MFSPPEKIGRPIEPVKRQRLELGKKVFKVPVPSKRRSTRKTLQHDWQKPSTTIEHNLLLQPTLKRQRKKRIERERKNNERKRATKHWRCSLTSEHESEIKISDVFIKRPRYCSKQRRRLKRNHPEIRQLARCAGVKRASDRLKMNNEKLETIKRESHVPPPFEPKDDDTYIIPQPGQLISYLWYTRPNPVYGEKKIYRTGVLCSNNGSIRFFDDESEENVKTNGERKFIENKFYLNKRVFANGAFRVRTDLVEGATCYEREMNLPCKLVQIDEKSGAVLVENLLIEDGGKKTLWISPDDLVGNFKYSRATKDKKNQSMKICDPHKHSQDFVKVHQRISGSTEEEEYQPHPVLSKPPVSLNVSRSSHFIPEKGLAPATSDTTSKKRVLKVPASWYASMGITNPRSKVDQSEPTPALEYRDYKNQNMQSSNTTNAMFGQPKIPYKPVLPRFPESSPRNEIVPAPLGLPVQMLSDTLAMNNHAIMIQSKLNLIKQHNMVVELLILTNDLATSVACLQYVKPLHQREIPVGPTAMKVVSAAEMKCQFLIEEQVERHLTQPEYSGGKGYTSLHARMMICQLAPILGPNLGRMDHPLVSITKLRLLGLLEQEACDIFPFIQGLEEDILLKSISIKRKLAMDLRL